MVTAVVVAMLWVSMIVVLTTTPGANSFSTPASLPAHHRLTSSSALHVSIRQSPSDIKARRKTLLERQGPYFSLDRPTGQIEFGASAQLTTALLLDSESPDPALIDAWLENSHSLALSIWDEQRVQDQGNDVYRLDVMPLQFVTLKVAPWVDMKMKTIHNDPDQRPAFVLQSIDFDPNVQVARNVKLDMNIIIDVAGELRTSANGRGVSGHITFATRGRLPPPLRLLPAQVLQAASNSIDQTIVKFAVQSFQRGATAQFQQFRRQQQQIVPTATSSS